MAKPIAIKPGKFAPTTPAVPVAGKPSKFGPVPGARVKTAPVDDQPIQTARTTVRKTKPEPEPVLEPVVEETAPADDFVVDDLSGSEAATATEEAPYDARWEEQVVNGEALVTEEEPVYAGSLPEGEQPTEEQVSGTEPQEEQDIPAQRQGRQPRRAATPPANAPAVVGSIFAESISIEVNRLNKILKLVNSGEDMPETLAALFASDNAMRFINLVVEDTKILATAKKFYAESTAGLPAAPAATATRASSPRAPRQGGALDKVVDFVTAQGSASRQQIISGTGIPGGSFAHLVKASGRFTQNEDKTWSVAG